MQRPMPIIWRTDSGYRLKVRHPDRILSFDWIGDKLVVSDGTKTYTDDRQREELAAGVVREFMLMGEDISHCHAIVDLMLECF